jgi:hypothetical protein
VKAKQPPMSREAWRIEGELVGHSVDQTLRYLSDCADWQDQQQDRWRTLPPYVILADAAEPRWVSRLRGLLGRAQ